MTYDLRPMTYDLRLLYDPTIDLRHTTYDIWLFYNIISTPYPLYFTWRLKLHIYQQIRPWRLRICQQYVTRLLTVRGICNILSIPCIKSGFSLKRNTHWHLRNSYFYGRPTESSRIYLKQPWAETGNKHNKDNKGIFVQIMLRRKGIKDSPKFIRVRATTIRP